MGIKPQGVLKAKDLIGIPWRVALALQAAGWWLRSDVIWHKPNPMPESVTDRPTRSHEYVFMLTKSERYWYDADAIREKTEKNSGGGWSVAYSKAQLAHGGESHYERVPFRNKRTVWTVATEPSPFPHFAMFPQALITPMILATCPAQVCATCGAGYVRVTERESLNPWQERKANGASNGSLTHGYNENHGKGMSHNLGVRTTTLGFRPACTCPQDAPPGRGIALDMFIGSGTTGLVAQRLGRDYIGCDLNEDYVKLARERLAYHGDDARLVREQAAGVTQLDMFESATDAAQLALLST